MCSLLLQMQIQATGPGGVNSELSERDASPRVRVCVMQGWGLKIIYLFYSLAPPRLLRHMTGAPQSRGPEGPTGPGYT